MRGFDPRAVGSGNIGTSNVVRAGGMSAAAMTLVGDALKGAIPVIVARAAGFPPRLSRGSAWPHLSARFVPCSSAFAAARASLPRSGIWLAISPTVILFALAAFVVVVAISRIMSLASIVRRDRAAARGCDSGLAPSLSAARDPDDGARAVSPSREYPAPVPRRGAEVPAQAAAGSRGVLAGARRLIGRPPVKHRLAPQGAAVKNCDAAMRIATTGARWHRACVHPWRWMLAQSRGID